MNNLTDKINDLTEDDVKKLVSKAIYAVCGTLLIIILAMTGCTMHSNTLDPARLREEVAIKKVEAEMTRAQIEVEREETIVKKERLKTFERLVALGGNPIAIRCGLSGWSAAGDTACVVAGAQENPINQYTENRDD